MDDDTKPLTDLATFCDKPHPGIQRVLTHGSHAVETDVHASAIANARPDDVMRAFLHSCDGRWIRTSRLLWLQLANEETTLRMQRYLRQPLSALAGIVGVVRLVKAGAQLVMDPHAGVVPTGVPVTTAYPAAGVQSAYVPDATVDEVYAVLAGHAGAG